ncbi:hypothetical protein CDD80_6886 [Ophiocordyceps camponoti-rufipedis]|uniref:ELYS-like domain-containing protein n=1 Tax=Ophiocordyceps camponoti-rufipedis TaxID=2004952 RepID=A0A2C5ZLA2_9HYPO|nr:hypothetical protein CDD80_6886 [Ophiocordyceps camponoti-rufipedis]
MAAMEGLTNFERVIPSSLKFPYDRNLQHEIEHHRKALGGTLFIDRVMTTLGLVKGSPRHPLRSSLLLLTALCEGRTYPPKSENALRQLHQLFCDSNMSVQHKQSLIYYILLDFDTESSQSSTSDSFAAGAGMPVNYQIFMRGLWLMDRQQFQEALKFVAHPSLKPDFADEIISTLVRYAPDDHGLALSYYYSMRPTLKTSSAMELLFDAMTGADATEALLFSRTHPQHTREQLFRRWVRSLLKEGRGEGRSSQRDQLAFLPLDSAEESWLEHYLTNGEGRNLARAKDTLVVRKIASDRFEDACKQRASDRWVAVLDGIKRGVDATHAG